MAKKLLIITILLVTSFSLMAQWTCETVDPEFDDAYKVAYTYTQEKNGVLSIGEYSLLGNSFIGGYYNFSSIGHDAVDYISWLLLGYVCEINGINWTDWTENEIRMKSFGLWVDSVWSGPGNIPLYLNVRGASCDEDVYCSVYSFEISFKVGETYKRYHNRDVDDMEELVDWLREDEVVVSYKYDRAERLGSYHIEWPSKEFWKDFKAASSVKFRIKHNENSDYQYYEFNMSGSTKAYNFVTANQKVCWLKDWIENKEKGLEKAELQKELKEKEKQKEKEKEDAEMQRELSNLTPPHELKFESTERSVIVFFENYQILPILNDSDCILAHNDFIHSNTISSENLLDNLGLCDCYSVYGKDYIDMMDIIDRSDKDHKHYQMVPVIEGLWLYSSYLDTIVPFDYFFSLYKQTSQKFCGYYDGQNGGLDVLDNLLPAYQVTWVQNPFQLLISTHNTTQVFSITDWTSNIRERALIVGREDGDGSPIIEDKKYFEWIYNIQSNNGINDYEIHIWRETSDPNSWETDIGEVLKLNKKELFSNNIGFMFVGSEERDNKLKIVK